MSSDAVWKQDAISVEHPSREAILAFVRNQCAEDEKHRIDEHLLTGCMICNRIHTGLEQDSNALSQLFDMSHLLYYPELQSNQTLLHMRRGVPLTSAWTGKRKRKFRVRNQNQLAGRHLDRKTGLRVFRLSFPVAFGLLLLFTTVAIVLAYTIVSIAQSQPNSSNQSGTRLYRSQSQQPTITGHQTPTATVTITPSPESTASPSATIIKGAKLEVCPWSQYSGWMVFVCGRGFKGVNKVWLAIEYHGSNSFKFSGPYFINNAGDFMVPVDLYCKGSPVIIVAANKAQQPLTLPLTYSSRSGCYLPTPNVTPGSHP